MKESGVGIVEFGAPGSLDHRQLTRRALLGMAGLGALAACTDGNPQAPTAAPGATPSPSSSTPPPTATSAPPTPTSAPLPPPDQLYYGASTPRANLASFEADLGTPLACYRSFFQASGVSALISQAQGDIQVGRVPMVSIKPPGSWAAAAQDTAWMDSLMGPLSDIPGPVYLIINHEPENDAHHFGEAADYVAMQQAALQRAALAGGQLTVVPILSSWSFDERAQRTPRHWNVVDAPIYGLDLYNPWSIDNGRPWVPFADKLTLAEREAAGRPVMIGEYGCRTDPAKPGRAAAWMHDAFDVALDQGVVAMSYFNSYQNSPDGTWELDAERLPVFRELLLSDEVARI